MPRRTVQTIEHEPRAPAPPPPPLGDDFFQQDDNVARLLVEQAGAVADAVVKVYKCGGPNSQGGRGVPTIRDAWLYQCPPHEFDEELLQIGHGPGKYRIRMYGTLADGTYGSLLNKILEVGPVPPWQREAAQARLQSVSGGNGSGGVTVNAGSSDIAKAMADALAPLIGAMAGMMKHDPGASRKEMLEEIRAIGEIMRPQADPLGSLGGLKAVMELAKSFSGNGDAGALTEESGPYAVLMKALETFGSMMQTAREQGALAAQPALPAPAAPAKANGGAGAPAPSQPAAQPAAPSAEDEQMQTFLKMQLALFLNAAKANGNPEIYAGLIVENAPEKLLDMMEAPNWFDELVKLAPDFAAHKPWCEQVRNIAMEALKETEEALPAADTADLPKEPEGSKSGV